MFIVPKYQGSLTTKLRCKLIRENQPPVYSEEFEGSVNPETIQARQATVSADRRPGDCYEGHAR